MKNYNYNEIDLVRLLKNKFVQHRMGFNYLNMMYKAFASGYMPKRVQDIINTLPIAGYVAPETVSYTANRLNVLVYNNGLNTDGLKMVTSIIQLALEKGNNELNYSKTIH